MNLTAPQALVWGGNTPHLSVPQEGYRLFDEPGCADTALSFWKRSALISRAVGRRGYGVVLLVGVPAMRTARVVSVVLVMLAGWYLFIAPSLKLNEEHQHKQLPKEKLTKEQVDLALLDLDKKVYPEIQLRIQAREEWLVRKLTLAGGLLAALLLYIWKPFGGERVEGGTPEAKRRQLEVELAAFLTSRPICAVLGLACVVSLFMDIHVRRSLLVIHQLGTWAAEYAAPAISRHQEGFPGWEPFIRGRAPGHEGMHFSLIDAIQTGDLGVMTLVLLAIYHWIFQDVSLRSNDRSPGLDWYNRMISWLVIGVLGLFLLGAHLTSGNFEFVQYARADKWRPRLFFPVFWGYFGAWLFILISTLAWDLVGVRNARRSQLRKKLEAGQQALQANTQKQGKHLETPEAGQQPLDRKGEAIHADQKQAHDEIMAKLLESNEITACAQQALEKRVERIEKHLDLPPLK